jgi:hypothetical protein
MENKKIDRMIDYIRRKDLDIQSGRDMEGKVCFVGDWNRYEKIESYLNRLESVTIMWDDDFQYCENCNRYFDATPGYYGDQAHMPVWVSRYDYVCQTCAKEFMEEVIDYYQNNCKTAIPSSLIEDLKKQGFVCLGDIDTNACKVFETGLHVGHNDDPKAIIEDLKKQGILCDYDYIFALTDTGQFDIHFALFLRPKFEKEE